MPYPKIMLCKSKRVKQQLPFFFITIWGCTLDSASAQCTDQQLSPVFFLPLGKSATERNPSVERMLVADTDAGSMNVDDSQPGSTKLSKGSQVVNKVFLDYHKTRNSNLLSSSCNAAEMFGMQTKKSLKMKVGMEGSKRPQIGDNRCDLTRCECW